MPIRVTSDDLQINMFNKKDLDVDGHLYKILSNSFHSSVESVTGYILGEHYEEEDFDCEFQADFQSPGESCEIWFEVVIEDAPCFFDPAFKEQMKRDCQKSIDLRQQITSKIETGISEEFGIKAEITIIKWKFGSLIIKGGVFLSRGEFTEAQVIDIQSIIQAVATNVFETSETSVRMKSENKVLNYSVIQLTFGLSHIDQEDPNKILQEEDLIKDVFMKSIVASHTKVG